jgi:hypothetical protein
MNKTSIHRGLTVVALGLALGAPALAGPPEDKAAFTARCARETLAQSPGAKAQVNAICGSRWDMVLATAPMADSMMALAPATGAAFDPASAAGRLSAVRWARTPAAGQLKSGSLGELAVGLLGKPAPGASFSWFKNGEPIPFDLEEALRVRGATVAMIGCLNYGAGEGGRVYRVNAPGKAPFALSISFRSAAVASQSSDYTATADFSARLPTLASLRKDGSEWMATCPL